MAANDSIECWRGGLLRLAGCSPAEIAQRIDILMQFCAAHGVSPDDMIAECRHGPERMARRASYLRAARQSEANLVVQSFLIHNGINIFGELVCMPATTDAVIREQGEQWKTRGSE